MTYMHVLQRCPRTLTCCWSLPLLAGVIAHASFGMLVSYCMVYSATSWGWSMFWVKDVFQDFHAIISFVGAMKFTLYLLLLIGATHRVPILVETYIWFFLVLVPLAFLGLLVALIVYAILQIYVPIALMVIQFSYALYNLYLLIVVINFRFFMGFETTALPWM